MAATTAGQTHMGVAAPGLNSAHALDKSISGCTAGGLGGGVDDDLSAHALPRAVDLWRAMDLSSPLVLDLVPDLPSPRGVVVGTCRLTNASA